MNEQQPAELDVRPAAGHNRATIHLAPADTEHLDAPRTMHRVLLAGEVPVGTDGRPSTSVAGTPLFQP